MPKHKAEITSRIETITPDDAGRWLSHNTHNRHVRPNLVARFAVAMRKGEWAVNGESIKFDWNGAMLDGQHRLAAVVESGATIQSLVIHNLPPTTQETVDTGARRTPGDIFALRGYKRATTLAAAARYLLLIEQGSVKRSMGGITTSKADPEISPQDLFVIVGRYPMLPESIDLTDPVRYIGASHSQMAALHAWLSKIDTADAATFFEQLGTGLGLTEGSPVYALRRWLEHASMEPTKHRKALNRVIVHALTIKAWNAFRRGDKVKNVRYVEGDDLPRPI